MTENTSRPPKSEDSVDDLGDPDATHELQENVSADDKGHPDTRTATGEEA